MCARMCVRVCRHYVGRSINTRLFVLFRLVFVDPCDVWVCHMFLTMCMLYVIWGLSVCVIVYSIVIPIHSLFNDVLCGRRCAPAICDNIVYVCCVFVAWCV